MQHPTVVDFSFLDVYCRKYVVEQYTPEEKLAVLRQYVGLYGSSPSIPLPKSHLELLLPRLITPLISASLEKGQVRLV